MLFHDFRDYLDKLEKQGLLLRVKQELSAKYEIAAGLRKISDTNGPAFLFERVAGYPGWMVVGGLFATRRLMAFALQTEDDDEQLVKRYLGFDQEYREPVPVASGPVKELILTGDDIDLTKLPVPTYCEMDSGPYLTAGVEIARHPVTGQQNASIHRRRILGKDRTCLLAQSPHLTFMIQAAEEQGQGLGIATVIGAHPALTIASQVKAPEGVNEMAIAGAIRGRPFEVVKCETIDVLVPADAEIVIEGVTVPGERASDGPFGEFPGNYISLSNWATPQGKPVNDSPVVKVTAITMRHDAIFQALLTGMPNTENQSLKKWALTAAAYRKAVKVVSSPDDIRGINLTSSSAGRHAIVSIRKREEATPKRIIESLMGIAFLVPIVVDEDIDVYDPAQV
ncbi:MAG: UbiD family decarboxylase, partial [Chloroflexota bacterium]